MKIYFLISGPLRPNNNTEYLFKQKENILKMFSNHECIFVVCYWHTNETDLSLLKNNFHHVIPINEPVDEFIFKTIKARTTQQIQLKGAIEHWTPRMYKLFYGIRCMIDFINENNLINQNDIVFRIRTDLHIDYFKDLDNVLDHIVDDGVYLKTRNSGGGSCDWFLLSKFKNFEKAYYFKDDESYEKVLGVSGNTELVVKNNCIRNKIKFINLGNYIKMGICRKYTSGVLDIDYRC